jgi:osmotically-inducible protein OsmY
MCFLRPLLPTLPAAFLLFSGVPVRAATGDSQIETAAHENYNFSICLKGDAIQVDCSRGMVKLTGTVSEDYHRILAEQTVLALPGVKSVDNQLAVSVQHRPRDPDEWITARVKSSLALPLSEAGEGLDVHTRGAWSS